MHWGLPWHSPLPFPMQLMGLSGCVSLNPTITKMLRHAKEISTPNTQCKSAQSEEHCWYFYLRLLQAAKCKFTVTWTGRPNTTQMFHDQLFFPLLWNSTSMFTFIPTLREHCARVIWDGNGSHMTVFFNWGGGVVYESKSVSGKKCLFKKVFRN